MSEYAALVRRLNESYEREMPSDTIRRKQAAAAITALEAQLAEMKESRDQWKQNWEANEAQVAQLQEQIEQLKMNLQLADSFAANAVEAEQYKQDAERWRYGVKYGFPLLQTRMFGGETHRQYRCNVGDTMEAVYADTPDAAIDSARAKT